MMEMRSLFLAACATGLVLTAPARAALVGSGITGTLHVGAVAKNQYDPALNAIDAIYLNSAGTTVIASDGAIEFGKSDSLRTFTADFSGDTLTLVDNVSATRALGWRQTFTSVRPGLFQGIELLSSDFEIGDPNIRNSGLSWALNGDTLTMKLEFFNFAPVGRRAASFRLATAALAAVPEPATWMTMIGGFGIAGAMTRRANRAAAARGSAGKGRARTARA